MKNKVLIIDAILLVGTFLIIVGLYSFYDKDVSLSPLEEQTILFSFNSDATKLFFSESLDFEGKKEIIIEDGFLIRLIPGKYYFEIEGEKEIRQITVLDKEIVLQLKKAGLVYGVVNVGDPLEVESYLYGNHERDFVLGGENA